MLPKYGDELVNDINSHSVDHICIDEITLIINHFAKKKTKNIALY